MLARRVRILNFDHSLTAQKNLIQRFHPAIIDLSKIGPRARHWMNAKTAREIKAFLSCELKSWITFLGSGDFHHLSSLLIGQFSQPLSVIVFDHHPDWDGFSPTLSCGAWINTLLKQENVKKIILLGPASDDLSSSGLITASFSGLKSGKLEIYPYEHQPSKAFFRFLKNIDCLQATNSFFGSAIKWKNLSHAKVDILLPEILARIPTQEVYVSIDKDCLKKEYALTNWEEGLMDLGWLLEALGVIKSKKDIVGMDITGDYSQVLVKGGIKKLISRLDHPKGAAELKMGEKASCLNESTNLKILDSLLA